MLPQMEKVLEIFFPRIYYLQSINNFDYFCTTLTVSPYKNSQIINSIGKKLSLKHPNTKYFYSDFKKNKGIDYAREMRIQYNLYQQLYCGCKFTYEKLLKKQENQ